MEYKRERPQLQIEETADRLTLTVGVSTIEMCAADVQELICHLGSMRMKLSPPVTREFDKKATQFVDNPSWMIGSHLFSGNLQLHIRDPRFGWLRYLFPLDEGRSIVKAVNEASTRVAVVSGSTSTKQ
jgi:hypothetical protein